MSLTLAQIQALGTDPNPRTILASDKGMRPFFIEEGQSGATANDGDGVFQNEIQTLQNKTLSTGTVISVATMTLGSDGTGDIYYRNAGGALTRLGIGSNGQALVVTAGLPAWGAAGGMTNFTESLNTTAPNSAIPAVRLIATNAAINVDFVIAPKGGGAILAQIPDSTSAGGNKRGVRSVDFQVNRTAANQVASGTDSAIIGGINNMASGSSSVVLGGGTNTAGSGANAAVVGGASNSATGISSFIYAGLSNSASGANSSATGNNNIADGQNSFAGGSHSTTRGITHARSWACSNASPAIGRQQHAEYMLRAITTSATQTELTTDGAAGTNATRIKLPTDNASYSFRGQVIARNGTTGDTAAWRFSGCIKIGANAASTALVGAVNQADTNADAGASSWTLVIDADTTNGTLRFRVVGAASGTTWWSAYVETLEIDI